MKETILWVCVLSTASLIILLAALFFDNIYFLGVMVGIYGFMTVALLPLFLEMSLEITFPVNEAVSAGIFLIANQLVALIAVYLLLKLTMLD